MRRFKTLVFFQAPGQEQANARVSDPRRGWAANRVFELSEKEFDELWPGIERLFRSRVEATPA